MKLLSLHACWVFIAAVALFDIALTVSHSREAMMYVEWNPFQLMVLRRFGVQAAASIRLASVLVACVMFLAMKDRLNRLRLTISVGVIHAIFLFMLMSYVVVYGVEAERVRILFSIRGNWW